MSREVDMPWPVREDWAAGAAMQDDAARDQKDDAPRTPGADQKSVGPPETARSPRGLDMIRKILANYGMIVVLVGLCVLFSILTLKEQMAEGSGAADPVAERITAELRKSDVILVAGASNTGAEPFAERLHEMLRRQGFTAAELVVGTPRDVRIALEKIESSGRKLAAIATCGSMAHSRLIEQVPERFPAFAGFRLMCPPTHVWPDFLKRTNLLAIVDRIVVIAVIAIGMSMVIITGGIDLSVGSLIALSSVVSTLLMKRMGGLEAPAWVVAVSFLVGILGCGVVGGIGGIIIARFKVAPFITTLAVMMMARGLAFIITGGFSIYQVPKALTWLGQEGMLGVPNTVLLLVILYVAAHIFMSHTPMGRYIYAVGGNQEAARLSGVPVRAVIVLVYIVSALAAGLGGCVQASQINTGTPNMGMMYELYVIAAVVVGGTSLSGGSGRMLGTLIGAFIISVIQNGMNLLGIGSYTQQVVLGAVILGAVLLDKARTSGGLGAFLQKKLDSVMGMVRRSRQ
jgi:ribose transport system permease protein